MKHQIEDKVNQFKDICDFKVNLSFAHHLWRVKYEAEFLDDVKAYLFYLLTAKLTYITKSKMPDI